jgi:hypothetical protein
MRRLLAAVVFFCSTVPAFATVQLVQEKDAGNQGTQNMSLSVALNNATTQGNLIVVYVAPNTNQQGAPIWVTDTSGNSYSAAPSTLTTGIPQCNVSQELFYAANINGGSDTVTATIPGSDGMGLVVLEYSGIATIDPLDVQAGTSQTTCPYSASPASASFTTAYSNDLIVSGAALTVGSTWTAGSNYTLRTGGSAAYAVEDQLVSSTGNYAGSFSLAGSNNWLAGAIAFKAAGASDAPACGHSLSSDSTNDPPGNTDWGSPTVPAEGHSNEDPTFGCTVVRLTDGFDDVSTDSASNGTYLSMLNYYSTLSPMNATDSLLLIASDDGGMRIKNTSGAIVVASSDMPSMNDTRIVWDASNGNVFYYAYGNSLMQGTVSGSSVSASTVHQFTEYDTIDFMDAADLSQDGSNVAIVGGDTTGSDSEYVFDYNLVTNTKGSVFTTSCTGSANAANNGCLHKLTLTPDNNVMIQFASDGSQTEQGLRLWAGGSLTALQDSTNHVDSGYNLSGVPVFIEMGNSTVLAGETNPCSSGWGLDVRDIYSLSTAICLLDNQPPWHVSYRGNSSQSWAALSFFDSSAGGTPPSPSAEYFNNAPSQCSGNDSPCYVNPSQQWVLYEDEIILARIDGNNNYIYRLAHAYSRSDENFTAQGDSGAYYAQPHAAISRDGKYVIFNSNMAHVNGCPTSPTGPYIADNCSDVYLIKVR